jgi:hypothetical protein
MPGDIVAGAGMGGVANSGDVGGSSPYGSGPANNGDASGSPGAMSYGGGEYGGSIDDYRGCGTHGGRWPLKVKTAYGGGTANDISQLEPGSKEWKHHQQPGTYNEETDEGYTPPAPAPPKPADFNKTPQVAENNQPRWPEKTAQWMRPLHSNLYQNFNPDLLQQELEQARKEQYG